MGAEAGVDKLLEASKASRHPRRLAEASRVWFELDGADESEPVSRSEYEVKVYNDSDSPIHSVRVLLEVGVWGTDRLPQTLQILDADSNNAEDSLVMQVWTDRPQPGRSATIALWHSTIGPHGRHTFEGFQTTPQSLRATITVRWIDVWRADCSMSTENALAGPKYCRVL